MPKKVPFPGWFRKRTAGKRNENQVQNLPGGTVQRIQRISVRPDADRLARTDAREADPHARHGIIRDPFVRVRNLELLDLPLQEFGHLRFVVQIERLLRQTREFGARRPREPAVHLLHHRRYEQ